ncbi:translocation and assembly module TamB [Polymorphobacter multimanifer]|uniref:Translocation and assembly module TamB n=1 Tax=Polymorphobacter multimanifer TaxID=1070431 RepID=A0A841LFR8_9SPHN|nr:translocation/assembly module TamB domain-containing protein [Polymorphobacter multimanifer]MBB6228022.1 translocation and assembly module TamB [Polymorphobacter multimanifer]
MAEASTPAPRRRRRRHLFRALAAIGVLFTMAAVAVFVLVGTQFGRNRIVSWLPLLPFESGLGIRIDRVDGQLWGQARLHGLKLSDPQGVFLEAPLVDLDWRPMAYLRANRLDVRTLTAADVRLLRLPKLLPTQNETLLPDYDILIGNFAVDRLLLEAPVAGRRQLLRGLGSADIRAGRARISLAMDTLDSLGRPLADAADRLRLTLDAEPAKDQLELAAAIDAPRGGVITGLTGLDRPLTLRLTGDGGWTRWAGRLRVELENSNLADVAITGNDGRFSAQGAVIPSLLLGGVLGRALGPKLVVDANAGLGSTGTRDLSLQLSGPALRIDLRGRLAASSEVIEDGRIAVALLRPELLYPQASGDDVRMTARLAGTLADPLIDWTLTARSAGWGATILRGVRGAGIVRPAAQDDGPGIALPLTLMVARVDGVAATAAPLLTELRGEGALRWFEGKLTGQRLKLRSRRITATASVAVEPARAAWRIGVDGRLPGYAIEGLGSGDVAAALVVTPAGAGARVTGTARFNTTRMTSAALLKALGGLPVLTTAIDVSPDLALRMSGLTLASPALKLVGDASLTRTGALTLALQGNAGAYGPLTLRATGSSTAPALQLTLARPGLGIGLAGVRAAISRAGNDWLIDADANSNFGPVQLRGLLETAGPLAFTIENASILGLTGTGRAVVTPAGPLAGRIMLRGDGTSGTLLLSDAAGSQRFDLDATASNARLQLDVPLQIERGTLKAGVRLVDGGIEGSGDFAFTGVERDGVLLDATNGSFRYAAGRGTATLHANGTRTLPFALDSDVRFEGDRIQVGGKLLLGTLPVTLVGPAQIVRAGNDWVLEPVTLIAGAGRAELSGRWGAQSRLTGQLRAMPLSVLTAFAPSLDFDGLVSGRIDLSLAEGGTPRGSTDLTLAGLTRSGAASSSLRINVGLKAELGIGGTVARAIITRAGRTEGRAQLRVGALTGEGGLLERLYAAPVSGQVRFNGPAQALWGLGGNDAIDVRGPVSLAASLSGAVGDPQLAGTLRMAGGRVEATVLGAVIENVALDSRFNGSRLELTRFSGTAGRGGTITGTGGIDLSAERSFPLDIRLRVNNAQLLNRDDYAGTGSGTLRIATDEYGGVVSGNLTVNRATFRIGRAAVADVPVLAVTERNTRSLGRPVLAYAPPTRWLLNLDVKGDRQLFVSGVGIESEWRADLRIRGGAYTPELFGRVELVRGDYDFAGKRFALTRGDVRFQGGYPPDPVIDIAAESSTSGFTAQLAIAGTANKPAIRFSSVPALPEDEVLSRLLFGESVTNLSAFEAVQLAGALASLRSNGGGFNPINSVRKGLGIDRLRILPADQLTGRGTAVAAGQYIGRNVYVELATDAQGYTATNIEISITRSLAILSQVATLGGTGAALRWQRDY